jgi:hypothetical protein
VKWSLMVHEKQRSILRKSELRLSHAPTMWRDCTTAVSRCPKTLRWSQSNCLMLCVLPLLTVTGDKRMGIRTPGAFAHAFQCTINHSTPIQKQSSSSSES